MQVTDHWAVGAISFSISLTPGCLAGPGVSLCFPWLSVPQSVATDGWGNRRVGLLWQLYGYCVSDRGLRCRVIFGVCTDWREAAYEVERMDCCVRIRVRSGLGCLLRSQLFWIDIASFAGIYAQYLLPGVHWGRRNVVSDVSRARCPLDRPGLSDT